MLFGPIYLNIMIRDMRIVYFWINLQICSTHASHGKNNQLKEQTKKPGSRRVF